MSSFDVIVVGSGPAGLAAGIANASRKTGSVCILERNSEPGCKFLLSGSGQCNITHCGRLSEFLTHYGDTKKSRFVKPALFSFDNLAVARFFEQRGVPLAERQDGKIFPASFRSGDLLKALVAEFHLHGGQLQTETVVESVAKIDGGFLLSANRGDFRTKKLILATGGCSYPLTGSRGDGFRFAESLGHRIVKPAPALTPVIVQNYSFTDSAGIAFWSPKIEVRRNNGNDRNSKHRKWGQGDVLLTHRGLSGPGILDLSRFIESGDTIFIAVISPGKIVPDLFTGKKSLQTVLRPLDIPERFLLQILFIHGISPTQPAAEIGRETRKKLESTLTGLPFTVKKLGGWNEAMATHGGVSLDEVNRQTLESRLVPNLFFCGELLDIDGDSGGYNIQFALSSGFLTGKLSK